MRTGLHKISLILAINGEVEKTWHGVIPEMPEVKTAHSEAGMMMKRLIMISKKHIKQNIQMLQMMKLSLRLKQQKYIHTGLVEAPDITQIS